MLAEGDTCRLLKEKFTHCVSNFSKRHRLSGLDAEDLANQRSDIFEELAKKMSIESEFSVDFGDSGAAYLTATIGHDDILSAIDPLVRETSKRLNLATDDERELLAEVMSAYSVGWAGNDHEFVFQGWSDPKNAASKDSTR
jgi:hypothetical protein